MNPEDLPRELARWMAAETDIVDPLTLPGDACERRLLVALADHDERQQWLATVVDEHLGADRQRIARAGSLGHPAHRPSRGQVPGLPGWSYRFHGRGCCLAHADGTEIDVDFDPGGADRIHVGFFERFLESVASPTPLDALLRRPEPFQHAWKVDLDGLHALGLLDGTHTFRLTESGHRWAAALGPVLHEVFTAAPGRGQRLALALGDFELACGPGAPPLPIAWQEPRRAALLMRFERLERRLREHHDASSLAALAVADRERARVIVRRILDEPPGALTTTALEMMKAWGEPIEQAVLLTLVRRASDADPQRTFLIEQGIERILQAHRADTLPHGVRTELVARLCSVDGLMEPATALLLFLLDPVEGLARLEHALGNDAPFARTEAAACLAVVGTPEAIDVLRSSDTEEAHLALAVLRGDDLGLPSEPRIEKVVMPASSPASSPTELFECSWLPEEVLAEVESMRQRLGPLLERWWSS